MTGLRLALMLLAWLLPSTLATPLAAETRLLMVEEPGCTYCAQWHAEIGPIYPRSAEGAAAPLERHDSRALPSDVSFARRVVYTPTFVLVIDGAEFSRIEGYPGEDFFWGLLGKMLKDAEVATAAAG